MVVERKYDWGGGGAGTRGCKAADYPHEASVREGQELGGGGAKALLAPLVPPPLLMDPLSKIFHHHYSS